MYSKHIWTSIKVTHVTEDCWQNEVSIAIDLGSARFHLGAFLFADFDIIHDLVELRAGNLIASDT